MTTMLMHDITQADVKVITLTDRQTDRQNRCVNIARWFHERTRTPDEKYTEEINLRVS